MCTMNMVHIFLRCSTISFLFTVTIAVQHGNSQASVFSTAVLADASTERIVLSSLSSPSELACSQKCMYNRRCNFKKFNQASSKCELLQCIAREDITDTAIVSKKGQAGVKKSSCHIPTKRFSADETKCVNTSLANTFKLNCSSKGIYKSCDAALKSNNNQKALYKILPAGLSSAISIECMRKNEKSFAVLHHSNENLTAVDGFEGMGEYKHDFTYALGISVVISIINQAQHCQQHTKALCLGVRFISQGYAWLNGRDHRKLDYWGGGPVEGTGCACGIANNCVKQLYKCNCDANDRKWRVDQGNIKKKEDLPVTSIALGDTGGSTERMSYVIGPLLCVI